MGECLGENVEDVHGGIAQCDVCRKDCRNKWHLGVHVKTVHEGRFAHCDVCKKECTNKQDLKVHVGDVQREELDNVMYAGSNAEVRGSL